MSRARYATDAVVAAAAAATVVAQVAPAAFTPPAAGGVAVTSTAATDLDVTTAGLVALRAEAVLYEIAITALTADVEAMRVELAATRSKLGF